MLTSRVAKRFISASRPALQEVAKAVVDPNNPEIAPTLVGWKNFKNEYYEKRGYTVAGKEWKEWEGLPEPYKYLGVKVDPAHVENHGPVWKFFSDWRTGVPATLLLSMPLWMFNILPPFDERLELALITVSAGWLAVSNAGPMFREWKRARVATKVKALLAAEKDLNDQINSSLDSFKSGAAVVDYIRIVNGAERALRVLEAQAATKKVINATKDSMLAQLDFLVQAQAAGAADTQSVVVKNARDTVEKNLLTDASLQQKTIDSAIKALQSGTSGDDLLTPLYSKAVEQAQKEQAASGKAEVKPLAKPQFRELYAKRFSKDKLLAIDYVKA